MIYTSDNDLVEMIEVHQYFDPTSLRIQTNSPIKRINLSVAKSATILRTKRIPTSCRACRILHIYKGASFVNGDNAIKVTGDEFSYNLLSPKTITSNQRLNIL